MKKWIPAAAALIVSLAASTTATAADGTFTFEGTKTPAPKDRAGAEKLLRFSYEAKAPRDSATGQASGKRTHSPVCITRQASAATTIFLQMLWTNELLKSITFDLSNQMRYRLLNANVTSFTVAPDKDEETVCFVFQRIEISFRGGQAVVDDWFVGAK